MRMRNSMLVALIILWLATTLAACGITTGSQTGLTVLAGSELQDLEPFLAQIRDNTGVSLNMRYVGTLDGTEMLMAGEDVDLAWFSHAKYLSILEGVNNRIVAQEPIMLSPVILGVKESDARAWGWIDNPDLTWSDIAAKAASGELRYAMTNPVSSNTGFTALVGVAAALSGTSDALQVDAINSEALQTFFKGQVLTAGSSGWLAESYVRQQDELNGMINYESILLELNQSGQLTEPLYMVYPKEGIITADYPLMLINSAERENYDTLLAYLRSPEFQRILMERTLRRPVIPEVTLSSQFPDQLLIELPFPNSVEVIDTLLLDYLNEQRIPSHAFFVLDVSGSMSGNRIQDLQTALNNLTGADQSLTGRFTRFHDRERVTLIPFSSRVEDIRHFEIDDSNSESATMEEIRAYVERLQAAGGTAIYSSLQEAYRLAEEAYQNDAERYYSIVLMTDGENNEGISERQFLEFYQSLPAEIQAIKTFPVLFGEADSRAMQRLAEATGGRVFDARSASLSVIFKQIRGYQ